MSEVGTIIIVALILLKAFMIYKNKNKGDLNETNQRNLQYI